MTVATGPNWAVRRLAGARLASMIGSGAAYAAIVYEVFEMTRSPIWVTVVLIATTGVRSVFLPLAGVLADTFGRRRVMLASDLLAGLCFAVLAFGWPAGTLVALAGLASLAESPFLPASAAAVPDLVPEQQLSAANGLLNSAANVGRSAGPVLALPLLAYGDPELVYACNAGSFVVSALLVLSVTLPGHSTTRRRQRRLAEGVRHIARTRPMYLIFASSLAAYVTTSFAMVAEPILAAHFGAGVLGYNLMNAGWGTGLVLGGWLVGRRLSARTEPAALLVGRLVMGAGMVAVPLSPWFAAVPPLMAVGGFGSGMLMVALHSQLQRLSPPGIRGTVFALFEGAGTGAFVVGVLVAGLVTEQVGFRGAYLAAGVGTLLTALPLYANVRRRPVPADAPADAPVEAPPPRP